MTRILNPSVLAAASALLLLALTGCTPGTPTPTATPAAIASPRPTPTPAPTVEPISAPEPRIDLTCAELGDALPLAGSFIEPVAAISRAATEYGAYPSRPEEYIVRSAGGLVCEFSNGQPQSRVLGPIPAYVGVRIFVLPDPGAQWDRYVSYYGISGDRDAYCAASSNCYLNALGGSSWVDGIVVGAVNDAAGTAVLDAALSAVTTSAPGAAPWTPPAGTLALPDDCATYIDGPELQSASGLSRVFDPTSYGGGGWSLFAGASAIDRSPSCFWAFEFADAGIGSLKVLRGGEWAWAEAREIVGSAPIAVAGLGADDEAWLRCGAGDSWCVVDLMLGGNWLELYLTDEDPGEPFDRRTVIQSIAATVVANVVP